MGNNVFISYRRQDGYMSAYLLYKELVERGYKVFFDIKSLRQGTFPDVIRENIQQCTDFILIVSPSAFSERITEENDWVRHEIKLALSLNKNIVPLFLNCNFPSKLPDDIKRISDYNGLNVSDPSMLDDIYKRLVKEFLVSIPIKDEKNVLSSRSSVYDANYGDEFNRLRIQADNAYAFDKQVIDSANVSGVVLDAGCAHGIVGKSRFCDERFTKVIGIDKSEKCIDYANEHNDNTNKYSYYLTDVESDTFVEDMRKIMEKEGIKGFDVIFAALLILHLKSPMNTLRKLRKLLAPGGKIIIRGSDDGSKLIYPDENNMMKQIIDLTMKIPGVSDRHNGRKICDLLRQTGYKDVRIYSYMRDTSGITYEERENMFKSSFAYRIDNVKKVWSQDPQNEDKFRDFDKMETLLALFENEFMKDSTWFVEYDYTGVATI